MAWGGCGPCQKKKKKNPLEYVEKIIRPSNVGHPAPPSYPYLHYSPSPSFSFRPYVLQIKQKADPLHLNTQVLTLTTKLLSLSLSLSQKTHPLTHGIPNSLYLLFFCFVFFDTFPLALVPLPTSPQNSSPLS